MARARHERLDDGELLRRTAEGDARAFGVFYERSETAVLGFFYRATRRSDLAVDLTAETFAGALGSVRSYQPERGSARSWLLGIARHELASAFERGRVEDVARRRLELETLVLTQSALKGVEQLAISGDGEALTLLDELPSDQQDAIRGRVLEDRDYRELAVSLACSASVARQRVSRGLRNLRSRLEQSR